MNTVPAGDVIGLAVEGGCADRARYPGLPTYCSFLFVSPLEGHGKPRENIFLRVSTEAFQSNCIKTMFLGRQMRRGIELELPGWRWYIHKCVTSGVFIWSNQADLIP